MSSHGMATNITKRENTDSHKAIHAGEGSNTAPCGNQGSPSQDPRDHMAQAKRHNNSLLITLKQTTTTPRRNESGEKKVKRTVKQPCGCAQSPLSSAFPIIILLAISCAQLFRCLLDRYSAKTSDLLLPE